MPYDRFMIAPIQGGLETDIKPWLVPDDAFARLNNAYVFRGRIRKRFGSRLMNSNANASIAQLSSRARVGLTGVNIGMTDGAGNIAGMVPGGVYAIGQKFLITDGATSEVMVVVELGTPGVMQTSGAAATHTFNTTTGAYVIAGSIATANVYFINEVTASAGVGMTDGAGAATGVVPGYIYQPGQLFSIGTQIYTVNVDGTPAVMLNTGAGAGVFNTTTGEYAFAGAPINTRVYFYPALPIMGLPSYETIDTFNDPTFAFDTEFAYQFSGGAWERLGTALWTGTNSDFFWATTWQGAFDYIRLFFVTNNVANDGIKYWNGATWTDFAPLINAGGDYLVTAKMLIVFKNHLLALGPTENISGANRTFTNAVRWAAFGDPTQADAWKQDIAGKGNTLTAATMEDIIAAQFVKDRLIVSFEDSTWELAFTGNQAQPFTWQKVNTELGAESTWSGVPFDKVALSVGQVGIHACNGINVERIDQKIPDSVWDIHDGSESVKRVYGVRDYYAEQVYWTFPNRDTNQFSSTYPNKILVYNYKTDSWAFNDDSITAFGYFYAANVSTVTWDSLDITWDNTEITWDSGRGQALNQLVLAGNQEGFIFIVDIDMNSNAAALQLTDMTINGNNQLELSIIDHNSNVGDFIYLQNLNGVTPIPPLDEFLGIYEITGISDENTLTISAPDVFESIDGGDVYTGGGTITRVSRIDMLTKQFNFYIKDDRNTYVQKVDFLVDRTDAGQITIDYLVSTSSQGTLEAARNSGALIGNGVLETSPYDLYPFEAQQDRLWHPVYLQGDGTSIQLRIYLSDEQLEQLAVATSAFQVHAMTFYCTRTSSRAQ